ncbi:MAG: DoxX family protein [Myxococcota bacterium]
MTPRLPRLREWAYAGFFFDLTGAFTAHLFVGDIPGAISPVVFLALLAPSSFLQPAALRLVPVDHEAVFRAGDIALMTAGRDITHEELPDPEDRAEVALIHFAQLWLALPDALEDAEPAFAR